MIRTRLENSRLCKAIGLAIGPVAVTLLFSRGDLEGWLATN